MSGSQDKPRVPPSQGPPGPEGGFWRLLWRLSGLLRSLRPHQWIKNVFVVAPVVFARGLFEPTRLIEAVGAFLVFCMLSGAVYTMNDLADRAADQAHPIKCRRPIASGQLPVAWARVAVLCLVVASMVLAGQGPWQFSATAVLYFLLNVAYSMGLKSVAYLDVSLIATGFVLRVLAGGFATRTAVSGYLVACTALLALFLGLGKRLHELKGATREESSRQRSALSGYSLRGTRWAVRATAVATVACYTAYTLDANTIASFGSSELWWSSIFVGFGVLRFLKLIVNSPHAESPTQEMLGDGPFVAILGGWVTVMLWIVYNLEPAR